MTTTLGSVSLTTDRGLTTITFEHPAHNSLPGALLDKLARAITEAGDSDETEVILLKSGGDRTFCAGASFDELIAIEDETTGKAFFMGFAKVINACRRCPKLIIGRVQGKAVGGGVGVASAVDFCYGTKYSAIKLSELAVGIGPFVVGPAVERKMGTAAFNQLAIDARQWQNAYWAKDRGLYAEVFDSVSAMDEEIDRLAQDLLSSSSAARTELKRVMWEDYDHWDTLLEERAVISGRLILTPAAKSAIEQFKSK